ncbi:uncharacterized protein AKAW2_30277S [Aspergillus luchuensis]|uniref:Uncharacterized protein n=1 Tax=Aspergillus kawachii TaxID=1069201 RepID=A0A7R7W5W1_ASPKA|nr:uncharacterized protein AKAW2_30277S [Aspergillus luchuensis]BCR96958.1 hypothetical protein AKAW2_30277S [Aspergillus luchuensis]
MSDLRGKKGVSPIGPREKSVGIGDLQFARERRSRCDLVDLSIAALRKGRGDQVTWPNVRLPPPYSSCSRQPNRNTILPSSQLNLPFTIPRILITLATRQSY